MEQKKIFKDILIVTVIVLSALPVIVTFSAFLTTLFNKMQWYSVLQEYVVPFESRLVAVIVRLAGITGSVTPNQTEFSIVLHKCVSELIPIRLEWNCLGWQSMILLVITLTTGLRGKYTFFSKFETLVIGILGTFLSNLFRMSLIVTLAFYWNSFAALIVHDYFASFVALVWMIFFWWFSYSFVLEEKH
jgi:exosortase/archaeosortase family protein